VNREEVCILSVGLSGKIDFPTYIYLFTSPVCPPPVEERSILCATSVSVPLTELRTVMELRRLEPILKSFPAPILPFLAPSTPPLWRPRLTLTRLLPISTVRRHARTLFTPTARQRADSNADDSTQQVRGQSLKAQNLIDSMLDRLLPKAPSTKTPRPSSLTDLQNGYSDYSSRSSLRDNVGMKNGDYYKRMAFPAPVQHSPPSSAPSAFLPSATLQAGMEVKPRAKRTIRSRATVGRTIEIDPVKGVDFGRALRNLDILCSSNGVKRDLQRQKFHERPGLKKKRLRSERWRRLFKLGFRATVLRVQEMRRKGW